MCAPVAWGYGPFDSRRACVFHSSFSWPSYSSICERVGVVKDCFSANWLCERIILSWWRVVCLRVDGRHLFGKVAGFSFCRLSEMSERECVVTW